MVLGSSFGMASFKEQITHGNQTKDILGIQLETLLKIQSCFLQFAFFKIDYAQLAEGLVVLGIVLDHEVVVLDWGVNVLTGAVEDLTQAEVCWDAIGIKLQGMLEVLCCLVCLTSISL